MAKMQDISSVVSHVIPQNVDNVCNVSSVFPSMVGRTIQGRAGWRIADDGSPVEVPAFTLTLLPGPYLASATGTADRFSLSIAFSKAIRLKAIEFDAPPGDRRRPKTVQVSLEDRVEGTSVILLQNDVGPWISSPDRGEGATTATLAIQECDIPEGGAMTLCVNVLCSWGSSEGRSRSVVGEEEASCILSGIRFLGNLTT